MFVYFYESKQYFCHFSIVNTTTRTILGGMLNWVVIAGTYIIHYYILLSLEIGITRSSRMPTAILIQLSKRMQAANPTVTGDATTNPF